MVSADLVKDNVSITSLLSDISITATAGTNIKCPIPGHEDSSPSFSINKEDKLFNCFGCNKSGSVIDLTMHLNNISFIDATKQLSEKYNLSLPKDPSYVFTAEYTYRDMFGKEKFRVRRYENPKRFVQGHVKDDKWVSNIQGIDSRLPYMLYHWYKSPDDSHTADPVIIVEGEKDVQNLTELGFLATCNAGGAGKFYKEHARWLENRRVIIIPDNDEAGRLHCAQVVQCTADYAKDIVIIDLPELPEKGDVSDWLKDPKNDKSALESLITAAIPLSQEQIDSYKSVKVDKRSVSSAENGHAGGRPAINYKEIAEKFVDKNIVDEVFTYKKHRGTWYHYTGKCYIEITKDDMKARIMSFILKLAETDKKLRPSTTIRDNVIACLEADDFGGLMSYRSMPMWRNNGDADGWMSLNNSIVDIRKLAEMKNGAKYSKDKYLRKHTPDYISTFYVNYSYKAKADCPLWMDYIETSLPDPDVRKSLQMMFGLCLIPDTSYEVFFLLFGKPGSGKSTALNVVKAIVGQNNCCALSPEKFDEKHSSHKLTEKLVNIVGELPNTGDLIKIEGKFKDVVSGAFIPVEKKYQDVTESHAIARNIFASNHYPEFSDKTGAILQRMRMICFNKKFRGEDNQINNLSGKIIKEELSGVFNWALQGLADLVKLNHFPENKEGEEIKVKEHYKNDNEARFLDECCMVVNNAFSDANSIYKEYTAFTVNNGNRSKSKVHFIDRVEILLPAVKHIQRHGGSRGFSNLKLRPAVIQPYTPGPDTATPV